MSRHRLNLDYAKSFSLVNRRHDKQARSVEMRLNLISVQISSDGTSVFYQGSIYDKNPQEVGPKTFLDKVAIKTGEKTRIYESDNKDIYERVSQVLDPDGTRYVLVREGPTTVPQSSIPSVTRPTDQLN